MKKTLLLLFMSFFSISAMSSCTKKVATPSSDNGDTPSNNGGNNGGNGDDVTDGYVISDLSYHNKTGDTVSGLALYNIMPYSDAKSIGESANSEDTKALFTIGMTDDPDHSYLYVTEDGLALAPAGDKYLQADVAADGKTLTPKKTNDSYKMAISDDYFNSKLPNDPEGNLLFKFIVNKFYSTYDANAGDHPGDQQNVELLCSFKKVITSHLSTGDYTSFKYLTNQSNSIAPTANLGFNLDFYGVATSDEAQSTANIIDCKKSLSDDDLKNNFYPNTIIQDGYFSLTINKKTDGKIVDTKTFYIGNDRTHTDAFNNDVDGAIAAIKAFDPDFTQG